MQELRGSMVGVAALVLAACGSDADSDMTARDADPGSVGVAENGDDAVKPLPGQYRTRIELLPVDLPGAPPGAAEFMRRSMGSQTHEYCLTPQEAEQSFAEMAKRSQDGNCTTQNYEADGNAFQAVLSCQSPAGTMRMTMNGTGTPTSSQIAMAMEGQFGDMGPASLRMTMNNERIGDCAG